MLLYRNICESKAVTQLLYHHGGHHWTIRRMVGHQKCEDMQIACTSIGSTGNLHIFTFLVTYYCIDTVHNGVYVLLKVDMKNKHVYIESKLEMVYQLQQTTCCTFNCAVCTCLFNLIYYGIYLISIRKLIGNKSVPYRLLKFGLFYRKWLGKWCLKRHVKWQKVGGIVGIQYGL